MTINNFKQKMIEKAKENGGIWEDFGQKELAELKDKYNYNDLLKCGMCLSTREKLVRNTIDELNEWAKTFDLSQL